jgi:hypothetical protein
MSDTVQILLPSQFGNNNAAPLLSPQEHIEQQKEKLWREILPHINQDPFCGRGAGIFLTIQSYETAAIYLLIESVKEQWEITVGEFKTTISIKPSWNVSWSVLRSIITEKERSWNFDKGSVKIPVASFSAEIIQDMAGTLRKMGWDVTLEEDGRDTESSRPVALILGMPRSTIYVEPELQSEAA